MFGKREWFNWRKYSGWGVTQKTKVTAVILAILVFFVAGLPAMAQYVQTEPDQLGIYSGFGFNNNNKYTEVCYLE